MTLKNENFGIATKAIIFHKGKYLILLKSKIEKINPDTYDIPGGRLELGEGLTKSLVREVKEETGLKDVKLIRPLINTYHTYRSSNKKRVLKKTNWYEMETGSSELVLQTDEGISDALWIKPLDFLQGDMATFNNVKDVLRAAITEDHG